jgi:hypothetical protein
MISQTRNSSPSQTAAMEDLVGQEREERQNVSMCGSELKLPSDFDRISATEEMRRQLGLLDRIDRRMSIQDYVACVLEAAASERPA